VLVLQDGGRRSFEYGAAVDLGLVVAHFGDRPLRRPVLRWRLLRGRTAIARGARRLDPIACGTRHRVNPLAIRPLSGRAPAKMELVCELVAEQGRVSRNHWPLWFFPPCRGAWLPPGVISALPALNPSLEPRQPCCAWAIPAGTRALVAHRLTDFFRRPMSHGVEYVEKGGRLLLLSNGALQEDEFWRYRTVPYNLGTTGNMGTVIHPHPALGDFPHEGWCDLQVLPLVEGAIPMDLAAFRPVKIKPIIRSIGHHLTLHDKAYLFEVALGKGMLLACSLNLQPLWDVHPAGAYLLRCLVNYVAGKTCRPAAAITVSQLKAALGTRA
jgi:hypothetical protein